jgi:PAS domain-containing protein
MNRPLIWVWGTFVGLGAGTLAFTSSVAAAVAVGLSAGACVWLATESVAAHWQTLVSAVARAARGLPLRDAELISLENPPELREVQTAAQKLSSLRAALDTLTEGFWVTTGDGTLLEHNVTVKKLLRLPDEVVGKHPRDFLNDVELLGAVDDACRNHRASSVTVAVAGMTARLRVHVAPLPRGGSSAVFMAVDC